MIGYALKTPDQTETVIPVINLTDEPCTLYRGTRIGEYYVITYYVDRVEGLLPVTLQYDDDSKDSEDEGCLRGGSFKYCPTITTFDLGWLTYVWILPINQNTCSR